MLGKKPTESEPRGWPVAAGALGAAGIFVAAALAVMAGLVATGALRLVPALLGVVVLSIAALATAFRQKRRQEGLRMPDVSPHGSTPFADEHFLETILRGLADPVVALDRDGRILAFNAKAAQIAPALRRGDLAQIAFRVPEVVEAIRRAREEGEPQRVEFSERVPLDRWYELVVTRLIFEAAAGQLPRDLLLMTFHDLTPLRRVEEMRADFVANASHELRTPLAALSGFIDTLQGTARDDPAARERFLPIMQAQATRMARLIDDLLSLSRIELSAHLRPETPTDLVSIVRQVTDGLETLARDRDVKIMVKAPPAPVVVLGDRDELLRVFDNLVENALKYGASGKRIEIEFANGKTPEGGAEVQVAVRDFGPGIAPEHLPRLTERFYRVDVAESRAQGGTGLGLALAKHILNRHGGRLSISSVLGKGATFTVHLPIPKAGTGISANQ